MTASLIVHTPSAYRCPLLIRRLLESGVRQAPRQEAAAGDRLCRPAEADLCRAGGADRPARRRTDRARHRPGRHGGGDGLGQQPLSRVLLRGADDGGGAAHDQRAAVARADPVHDQPRRRRRDPRQRRVPADARGGSRAARSWC
jgi:hypothetical protein